MKTFLRLAACLLSTALPQAHAGQYSDIWFNPQQPGWGVNVVQQLETAFVTLYVYDAAGKPTWYVASDARITAYSSPGGFPVFSGALYKTTGSFHGGPYAPGSLTTAGDLQLEVIAKDRMRVHYTADGVSVVREVSRLTFQEPLGAANYAAQFRLRMARPGGAPFAVNEYQGEVLVHFDEGRGFMRVDDHLGRRCEYRGSYEQAGKLTRFAGEFTCSAGDALVGTFEVSDMEVTEHGVTGLLRTLGPDLSQSGRFAALRY